MVALVKIGLCGAFASSALLQTLALEVNASQSAATARGSCAAEMQVCGILGKVYPSCCDNLRCSDTFLGVGVCKQGTNELSPPACAAQGSPCGDHASPSDCCDGTVCEPHRSSFRCSSEGSLCVPEGNICGYDGSSEVGECCAGFSCTDAARGVMRCTSHQQTCAVKHATCSVDGQAFPKCCDDMTCTHTFNGVGTCKNVAANKACSTQGSLCGPGHSPSKCCGELDCKHTQDGDKKCKNGSHSCVPSGELCAVPGMAGHANCCGASKSCQQSRSDFMWKCQ